SRQATTVSVQRLRNSELQLDDRHEIQERPELRAVPARTPLEEAAAVSTSRLVRPGGARSPERVCEPDRQDQFRSGLKPAAAEPAVRKPARSMLVRSTPARNTPESHIRAPAR